MRDYVSRSKFTHKPRLREISSNFRNVPVFFFLIFAALRNFIISLQIYIFKVSLVVK